MIKADTNIEIVYKEGYSEVSYVPSIVDKKEYIEIKEAVMKIPVSVLNGYTEGFKIYKVEGENLEIIDEVKEAGSNGCIVIDISEEIKDLLKSDGEIITLRIENATSERISFLSNKEVIIRYESISKKKEEATYKVDIKRAGELETNLNSGNIKLTHHDLDAPLSLPISLSHTYKTRLAKQDKEKVLFSDKLKEVTSYKYGKGWKLNLEQYLVKEHSEGNYLEDSKTSSRYTYIDAAGEHHEFLDRYYYKEGESKVYVKASEVTIEQDGSLKYEGKEVSKETITETGIKLVSGLENYKDIKYVSKEIEEIASLKEELKSINYTLEQYQKNLEYNTRSLAILNLNTELRGLNKEVSELSLEKEASDIALEKELIDARKSVAESSKNYNKLSRERVYTDLGMLESDEYRIKTVYDTTENYIETRTNTGLESAITKREAIKNKSDVVLGKNENLSQEQESLERTKINDEIVNIKSLIEEYEIKKVQKEYELSELEKQVPEHYLVNEGVILGFTKTKDSEIYRLTLIFDNYDNVIYLEYKENKLVKMIDNKEKEITLEYKEDLLSEIKDGRNRKVRFIYEEGKLIEIEYPNKRRSKYEYDSEGLLVKIENSSGYGYEVGYTNKQVSNIKEISKISKITSEGIETGDYQRKKEVEIEYLNRHLTSIIDKKTKKRVNYLFNKDGEVETIYDNKFENEGIVGNVNVTNYQKEGNKKSFTIKDKKYAIEQLDGISFVGYEEESESEYYLGESYLGESELVEITSEENSVSDKRIYEINGSTSKLEKVINGERLERLVQSKESDFILSGWAKADSAYVERKVTDYSDNDKESELLEESEITRIIKASSDRYKSNRRFELRAELTYINNGETRVDSQYCSYDYLNVNWQYCALPVTLSEDENDILTEIKVIFDYTNNIGSAKFSKMSLKSGLWEYKEYDEDKQVTYYQTSESNVITTYEYEDKMLVKELLKRNNKEYETRYEYDNNQRLLRTIGFNNIISENEYDDKGQLIRSYTYHKNNPSYKLYSSEVNLDETGKEKGLVNEFGKLISEYEYQKDSDLLISETYKGSKKVYGYDYNDDTLLSISKDDNSNIYGYTQDYLTSLKHNNFSYKYEYDGFDNVTKVKIANEDYLENTYEDIIENEVLVGEKVTSRYSNGDTYVTYLNNEGNVTKLEYLNSSNVTSTLVINTYDTYGNLLINKDVVNEIETSYIYDDKGNIVSTTQTRNGKEIKVENEYDSEGNVTKDILTYEEYTRESTYEYDDYKLISLTLANNQKETLEYDDLLRIKGYSYGDNYHKSYRYLTKQEISSNLIESEYFSINNKEEVLTYEYDDYGNIVKIKENDEEIVRYEYDSNLRLKREDNKKLNKTIVYNYDKGGNITSRREYEYTLDNVSMLESKSYLYQYSFLGNRDRLKSYNGEIIEYDALGNPIIYRDKSLVWDKGCLKQYGDISYNYDARGLRTSKTVSKVITHYYYHNDKLLAQDNGNLLFFNYGVNGIEGFSYVGVGEYHYKKNILGDIISILDSDNNEIVKYEYDAYGNHKTYVINDTSYVDIESEVSYTTSGLNNKLIAELNPFRYRGYYYDLETQLYWVSSRYYSPELCRWISPDSIEYLDPESINGLNLYAYCGNDPINKYDPSGHFAISALIIGAIIGAAIGFGGTVLADYVDDGQIFNGSISAGSYIANTLVGGLIGGLTGGIASSSFTFTYPTLQFAQMATTEGLILGSVSVGTATATISGVSVVTALGLAGVTVMAARIGKSGGYRIDHHYPNDHAPTHVHISGDDGTTRVDINGNPIQGDRPMTPGERKAFWKLIEKIIEALKPWM